MRWRADVTADMRLLHEGQVLNIVSVVDPDARRKIIDIYCASSSGG
jgi:SPP1 family predicted phage head-tail adaptor